MTNSVNAMPVKGYPQLRELGVGLGLAIIALLLSGVVLSFTYLQLSPELIHQQIVTGGGISKPWPFSGGSLIARRGAGEETETGGLRITELEVGPNDTRSIYTRRAGFKAEDFPYVEYQITGQSPDTFYYFIWRTADSPKETSHIALPRINDAPHVSMLSSNPAWTGTITEIGVDVYGELHDKSQTIERLTMLPVSHLHFLRSIWSEWAGLETWTQRSAHHLMGGPYNPILARPLAMAAWAGGALLLLAIARVITGLDVRIATVLAVLIPWLVIDLLWQRNLSAQVAETRHEFGGKSQHEKHLAELDHELYEYALRLKADVLPDPGVRIFLLHDSPLRVYRRLKMQYYLLPHNIYNFDKYPRPESLQDGDYLLILDIVPGLAFDESAAVLTWHNLSLPVEVVDSDNMGSLYRFRSDR